MKTRSKVIIKDTPIRFLPECGQGLKSWLTSYKKELYTINELSTEIKNKAPGRYSFYISEQAARHLTLILLKYEGVHTTEIDLNVPRKYEALVDFNKFIVE